MKKVVSVVLGLLIGGLSTAAVQASPATFLLKLLGLADQEVTTEPVGPHDHAPGNFPHTVPPGWSQAGPGSGPNFPPGPGKDD